MTSFCTTILLTSSTPSSYSLLSSPSPFLLFSTRRPAIYNGGSIERRPVVASARMGEEEKLTRRNPLDFPIVWEAPFIAVFAYNNYWSGSTFPSRQIVFKIEHLALAASYLGEWERPKPGRRPDIFPQFSPMKTPLPPPMPYDPPEEDEEEEEKKEEEEDPEKEEGDNPESRWFPFRW